MADKGAEFVGAFQFRSSTRPGLIHVCLPTGGCFELPPDDAEVIGDGFLRAAEKARQAGHDGRAEADPVNRVATDVANLIQSLDLAGRMLGRSAFAEGRALGAAAAAIGSGIAATMASPDHGAEFDFLEAALTWAEKLSPEMADPASEGGKKTAALRAWAAEARRQSADWRARKAAAPHN